MKTHSLIVGILASSITVVLYVTATMAARSEHARKLPMAIEQSIHKAFPNGQINEIQYERRVVKLFEVTVIDQGEEHDLTLSQDGTIVSISREIDPSQLPTAVRQAMREVAGASPLQEADKINIRAELRAVPMKESRTAYEAEFRKRNSIQEVLVSENGTILRRPRTLDIEDAN